MHLIDVVRRSIREHALAPSGTRVVVAVSGGSDSVALAHLLRELADAGELHVAGVAHFNHQLRETADRDERFVREAAETLGCRPGTVRAYLRQRAFPFYALGRAARLIRIRRSDLDAWIEQGRVEPGDRP